MSRKPVGTSPEEVELQGLRAALRRLGEERDKLALRMAQDRSRWAEIQQLMASLRHVGGPELTADGFEESERLLLEPRPPTWPQIGAARRKAAGMAPALAARNAAAAQADRLRADSISSHARVVLQAAGRPLHVDNIVDALATQGVDVKKKSLVVILARLASAKHVFCRVKGERNTFGLEEWTVRKPRRKKR